MRVESRARNKRLRFADAFDRSALALLPSDQRALLFEWLRSAAQSRRWDSLLKLAGAARIEAAESLAVALATCGAATLEERFERSVWTPTALVWRDYEALCEAMGIRTQNMRRQAFSAEWSTARQILWARSELAEAYETLRDAPADTGLARLELLTKLNDWLFQEKGGTRREFSLFARGHTKQISATEWAWLAEAIDLADCGIERHAPALWLAGDVQLQFGERWLDIACAGDFLALTPASLKRLTGGKTGATHYRVVENRTSFENLVRKTSPSAREIVLWLPGYAPGWWREAVTALIAVMPAPAHISCDADPDGVQIALHAGALWRARGLDWEPYAMGAADAAGARHKLALTDRDLQLARSLLFRPDLPPALGELLQWCMDHRCKAEQENWL